MFDQDERPETKAGVESVDLSGTTVLVTGSTSGIGRAAALSMGRLGAEVIVHGRNKTAGTEVVETIANSAGTARFIRADFEDPEEVSTLGRELAESIDQLDVLCNNAGGFFRDQGPTALGVDRSFHINHLAPYQLTAELLEVLGKGSRVITTSSVAHRGTTLSIDTLMDVTGLGPMAAYCRSKLANVLFANELADRFTATGRQITSNSFHPGVIPGSEFGRSMPGITADLLDLFDHAPFTESVADGAATLVYLACAPSLAETTGSYFARCRQYRPARAARNKEMQRKLWRKSAEILDMDEPLQQASGATGVN